MYLTKLREVLSLMNKTKNNLLRNLSLTLRKHFLAEPIFKIGALNLLNMEPTCCYYRILKFRGQKGVFRIQSNIYDRAFLQKLLAAFSR